MDACGRKKDVFDMMDLRNVLWEGIFKLSASAASEFCEWVQVAIDIYIYSAVTPLCRWNLKNFQCHQMEGDLHFLIFKTGHLFWPKFASIPPNFWEILQFSANFSIEFLKIGTFHQNFSLF